MMCIYIQYIYDAIIHNVCIRLYIYIYTAHLPAISAPWHAPEWSWTSVVRTQRGHLETPCLGAKANTKTIVIIDDNE